MEELMRIVLELQRNVERLLSQESSTFSGVASRILTDSNGDVLSDSNGDVLTA